MMHHYHHSRRKWHNSCAVLFFATDSNMLFVREGHEWISGPRGARCVFTHK